LASRPAKPASGRKRDAHRSIRRAQRVECRCSIVEEPDGEEAYDYANGHLERVDEEGGAWLLRCPLTNQE